MLLVAPVGQGRRDRRDRRPRRPDDHLRPHQARRRPGRRAAARGGRPRRCAARRPDPGRPHPDRSVRSRTARCPSWSPPTSPPAASTSTTSVWSSTSTRRPDHKDYLHRAGRTARAGEYRHRGDPGPAAPAPRGRPAHPPGGCADRPAERRAGRHPLWWPPPVPGSPAARPVSQQEFEKLVAPPARARRPSPGRATAAAGASAAAPRRRPSSALLRVSAAPDGLSGHR